MVVFSYAFKLLKIPQINFNYTYLVFIPKFYITAVSFRTVTISCNTHGNSVSKILLNILKQIYDKTFNIDNTQSLKIGCQLVDFINQKYY